MAQIQSTTVGSTGEKMSKVSMRLFGMPYQMPHTVDPRDKSINPAIGKNYLEKFVIEAPVLTIIPGDPVFLPEFHGGTNKAGAAVALLEASGDGDGGKFANFASGFNKDDNNIRLYDFRKSYKEYMRYVNLLCRVGAGYLDLDAEVNFGKGSTKLQNYDWKQYKWTDAGSNVQNFVNWIAGALKSHTPVGVNDDGEEDAANGMSFLEVLNDYDFVQFYIDPDSISNDDMGNSSSESMMKGLFDGISGKTRELAWMMRNGEATSNMAQWASESVNDLGAFVTEALTGDSAGVSSLTTAVSRIINLSSNVVMGENVIIPNIYSSSSYNKSGFSATIHLKAPYGNVLSYYLDVYVPLMHLVALTIPRQSSPNTYSSPFLCKSFVEGSWTCNLGLVSGLSISKNNESRSINGLPSEVDVTIQFEDLYATLSMNPTSEPNQFAKNPSLVEYLATNCGVSLTKANAEKKVGTYFNSIINAVTDAPGNAWGAATNAMYEGTIGRLRSLLGLGYH